MCSPVDNKPANGTGASTDLTGPAEVSSKCHNAPMMSSYGGCGPPLLAPLWFCCVMKYVSLDVWLQEKPKSKIESH